MVGRAAWRRSPARRQGAVAASGGRRSAATGPAQGSGGGERRPAPESGEADEVVGGGGQVTGHPGAVQAAVTNAPEATDRLDPPEDLLDPGPDPLAERV